MIYALRLKNFKAFREVTIPLSQLTLLSGLNGSGKSTVLQALGLLRQSWDAGFLLSGDLILNGDLVELGTGADILYHQFDEPEVSIDIYLQSVLGDTTLRWSAPIDTSADVLSCTTKPGRDSISGHGEMQIFSLLDFGFQFLRADRITPSVTFPKSHHAVRHQRFIGPRGDFTAHYLLEFGASKIANLKLIHASEPEAHSLLAQVNAWLQEFSPGVRVEPHPVPMTDFVRLAFSCRGQGVSYGAPLRPTNVGFGLTHSLPVITACLGAEPGSFIVVENPEAQLHPKGQVAIGRLLALTAAGGVQVIAESHSDHVLNGIRLAVKEGHLDPGNTMFHFFHREPGNQSTFETPGLTKDGRLSYWPSGFFDQWERSLDQLLD
ncbi:putative ATPase [Inquilinus ginsengisoli]|uniref:AAA family ATPase n=1 Tax=Inquilinus ginsengisoli TaxID=363840 RepID=UPI003D1BC762